ncbi:MAG: PAS domain S-box protein, partial [Magnetococcales bacterium]|nr:PAS domain S-box protein [Magnetococcales bacterium]
MLSRSLRQTLLEKNVDAMLVVDRSGRIRYANQAAERLFSREQGDLINRELGFPVTIGESSEVDLVRRDGEARVAEMRAVEIPWPKKSMVFLVSLRDITERKRLEEELREAKLAAEAAHEAKNRFLANMSHELRTPLNAVIGFSGLLLEKEMGALTDTQEEFLNGVLRSGRELLGLVNNLLDLADAVSGQTAMRRRLFDLKVFLATHISHAREMAATRNQRIHADWMEAPELLRTDPTLLGRVLNVLLDNAMKFSPEGGRIDLIARKAPNPAGKAGLELSVADAGIGIAPEDLERIFLPFEQVDLTNGRLFSGAGVGLTLARQWVALLGGEVVAVSRGGQQGSQ